MSSSPEFKKVLSLSAFLRPGLIPAGLAGLMSGLCLLFSLVLSGGVLWLMVSASDPSSSGGLLPLAETIQSTPPGQFLARLIRAVPALQNRTSAASWLAGMIAVLLIVRWLFHLLAASAVERHVGDAALRLRQHIHRKAIRLEPADLTGEQTRSADRLFRTETRVVETSASRWGRLLIIGIPELMGSVAAGLLINWRVALQAIIPVLLGHFLLRRETERNDSALRLLLDQVERGLGRMAEGLKKTRIVTSFGMEQTEHQQFENHLHEYRTRCRQLAWQQSVGRGIQNFCLLLLIAVPAAILLTHVMRGDHVAGAAVIGCCLIIVRRQLVRLQQLPELSTEGSESAEEIAAYIRRIPSVSQAAGAVFLEPMTKTLTFNQISLQTPQTPDLLRGLDLRINFGEKIALLSLTPAPAYALASMIPRFLDPDLGQVLIDGRDIRQATLESLRAEAIFVGGQDPVFSTTVLENITCGQQDISRQQAQDAAKLVHADQFIRTLPKGYDTVLGEHGTALDPGQMFRLNLARAVVRQPALMIIEEPPLPLDSETKALLDDAYQRVSSNRTVIFLPFRLSTVKRCSRVVLIHEGRVAVDGVHEQLVRSSELYKHWEYVRFNPFREESEIGTPVI